MLLSRFCAFAADPPSLAKDQLKGFSTHPPLIDRHPSLADVNSVMPKIEHFEFKEDGFIGFNQNYWNVEAPEKFGFGKQFKFLRTRQNPSRLIAMAFKPDSGKIEAIFDYSSKDSTATAISIKGNGIYGITRCSVAKQPANKIESCLSISKGMCKAMLNVTRDLFPSHRKPLNELRKEKYEILLKAITECRNKNSKICDDLYSLSLNSNGPSSKQFSISDYWTISEFQKWSTVVVGRMANLGRPVRLGKDITNTVVNDFKGSSALDHFETIAKTCKDTRFGYGSPHDESLIKASVVGFTDDGADSKDKNRHKGLDGFIVK